MGKVLWKGGRRKHEVGSQASVVEAVADLDARMEMIQALIPLGLKAVHEKLKRAVVELAGPRYQRWPGRTGSSTGGARSGARSIWRTRRCRYRCRGFGTVTWPGGAAASVRAVAGAAGRDVQLAGAGAAGPGLPQLPGDGSAGAGGVWAVGLDGVAAVYPGERAKLQELQERDLSGYDLVALFLDGKSFGDDETGDRDRGDLAGTKVVLGLVQTASENTKVCREFLKSLVERGLEFEPGAVCACSTGRRGSTARCARFRGRGDDPAMPLAQAGERARVPARSRAGRRCGGSSRRPTTSRRTRKRRPR